MKHLRSFRLFESAQHNTLICVDVQPAYEKFATYKMGEFMRFLNVAIDEYDRVIYFFNGPDLGYEDQSTLEEWMVNNGFDYDRLDDLEFFDKGYGWFRTCMDEGYMDDVEELLSWMYSEGKDSTSDIDDDEWDRLIEKNSTFGELRDLIDNNGDVYFPEAFNFLENVNSGIDMVGGQQNECLKEVEIMLSVLDKDYDLISEWVY